LQGYTIETLELKPPIGFARFHKDLKNLQKGGEHCQGDREIERQGRNTKNRSAYRGEKEPDEVAGGWSEKVAAGGGSSPARGEEIRQRQRDAGGWEIKQRSLALSGWRPFFKTRDGRTGQSTVPVRCTPDSAQ
jgi:hypothetical protein